jgi:hypothetical protein
MEGQAGTMVRPLLSGEPANSEVVEAFGVVVPTPADAAQLGRPRHLVRRKIYLQMGARVPTQPPGEFVARWQAVMQAVEAVGVDESGPLSSAWRAPATGFVGTSLPGLAGERGCEAMVELVALGVHREWR